MPHAFMQSVLEEDIGRGDLFENTVSPTAAQASIRAKSSGLFAGLPFARAACDILEISIVFSLNDGDTFVAGDTLLEIQGQNTPLLKLERTLLNTLQHCSGIATQTNRYVSQIADLPVKLLDTRKTRPLLRKMEKYAVRIGGACNHRMGLDDCLMLKDTHLATIPDLESYVQLARRQIPFTAKIEIECDTPEFAEKAMRCGADIIMCDNMTPEIISDVVAFRNSHFPGILIEASGNITLESIRDYALSGVDAISSGSMIHQATWVDISMHIHK